MNFIVPGLCGVSSCLHIALPSPHGRANQRARFSDKRRNAMPKFVIEREIPGAGKLSKQDLQAISQKSCDVLREMGPQIQWQQSFVTDDKIYCIYIASDEEAVKTHARKGGFPANRISAVRAVIDPVTAEAAS
jgi:hypothetical protein